VLVRHFRPSAEEGRDEKNTQLREVRKTRIRLFTLTALLVIVSASLISPHPVSATETNYQNPVTAAPPLARPTTPSCVVTLAKTQPFPFAGYSTPFTGTYSPPISCPAPWSMVVLDFSGHVSGRQFDRMAAIWIGNAIVYMGTTPEPTPAGIAWHTDKDVSEYTSLLLSSQSYAIQVPNLITKVYTGIIYVNSTLTFYETSPAFPAARHPDTIAPLSGSWLFLFHRTPVNATPVTLPTSPVPAYLELWAKGNSCDEFWFGSQPDGYANANGLCGGGAFREIQVFLDGTLAGVIWPFPYVFTGGVNPYLWRPIPAVDAFNEPAYLVDLTPFVGTMADAKPHTIGFEVVNNGVYWQVDGNLLIDRDPVLQPTSGQLTNYQISFGAAQSVSQTINNQSASFSFTTSRSLKIAGFVDTSAGRVTTTVDQSFSFTNNQVLDLVNFLENLKGTETITTTTSTTSSQGTRTATVSDSYPVAMTSAFTIPGAVASSNADQATLRFILPATVDQSFIRTVTSAVRSVQILSTTISDNVHSEAALVRSLTTGFNVVASGHDYEDYIMSGSTGLCFNHYIAAAQGFITVDTMRPAC